MKPQEKQAIRRSLPATRSQQEIFSLLRLSREANCACNLLAWIPLEGEPDTCLLEKSLNDVLARHEILRAVFSEDGRTMTIRSQGPAKTSEVDLSARSPAEQEELFRKVVESESGTPFDPVKGPLVRYTLVRLGADSHRLLITAHALICDDWSLGILCRDLAVFYRSGQESILPDLPVTDRFSQYVEREKRCRLADDSERKDLAYWEQVLTPVPEPLDIPSWKSRPRTRTYGSTCEEFVLDRVAAQRLGRVAKRLDVSPDYLAAAALALFLNRICRHDDLILGLSLASQELDELPEMTGQCVNLLPLRFRFDPEESFRQYLEQCCGMLSSALGHRHITLGSLVRHLEVPRDPVRPALVSVLFNTCRSGEVFDGADITFPCRAFDPFELTFDLVRKEEDLVLRCQYNSDLFDRESISLYLEGVDSLLGSGLEDPDRATGNLPLVSPAQAKLLLEEMNRTELELPPVATILDLFREQVVKKSNKMAVVFREQVLSYAELDEYSDRLAAAIIAHGAGPGALVGIHLHRSHRMYIAVLGILKSGAGYVPLDPAFPRDRLEYMIRDSGLVALVTEQGLPVEPFAVETSCVDIDAILGDGGQPDKEVLARSAPAGDSTAYVIYTSGSTGKPKGVAVPHRGLLNLMVSMREEPGMSEEDRLLAVTTMSFDMSVPELYLPLITGATVVVAGKEDVTDGSRLVRLLEEEEITVFQATPSTWRMLLAAGWQGNARLKGLIGGEPLPRSLTEDLVPLIGQLWNMYGPTETTVWSTAYLVNRDELQILIGRPIANTRLYVLDERMRLLPKGVPGELYIGGAGVTLGYLNRQELNERAFVANPFSREEGDIIYRTGDLVRYRPAGQLEYISRLDHQVKLRGYRIELGEIEAAITSATGIKEVVVNIYTMAEEDQRLVAYIRKEREVDLESLHKELAARLPHYMLPQHYMLLDIFPLTANGKIDRKRLPRPVRDQQNAQAETVEPRNDFEYSLVEVWRRVLKVEQIGISDNFFDLGGHSLLALILVNEMKKATGIDISYGAVFTFPTIRELVDNLGTAARKQASSVVTLQPAGEGIPLFCLCGINLYRPLALSLGRRQPVYAIYVEEEQALLENAAQGKVVQLSVRRLAESYVAAVVRQQPAGPYQLLGISFGGIVAIEVARLLQEQGLEVRRVFMLDTILPQGRRKKTMGLLKHHFNKMKQKGPGYLLRRSKKKIRKTIYRQPWMREDSGEAEKTAVRFREIAYLQAMEDYQVDIRPYSGDVVLFRAAEKWGQDGVVEYSHDYGWSTHVRGNLDICDVPGDHLGIISPPHVQSLADRLAGMLV